MRYRLACCLDGQESRLGLDMARPPSRARCQCRFRKARGSGKHAHVSRSQCVANTARTCQEGPFGELLRATGSMAKANHFRFSTKYQDDETDLLYYGYRYYNASTGRWLSRDPWEEKGGLNLYGNVANNLLSNSDPDGRGMRDCLKALAELAKATAKMTGRVDDMVRWVEGGKEVDPGHQKALQQAMNGVNNALDRVKKQCGCLLDAAALATVLTAAGEALAAAAEWLPWVIAF